MSNWKKVRDELEPMVRELEKIIEGYDYSEGKAELTDKKVRRKLMSEARKAKNLILEITELAYKDRESEIVEGFREIIDEIDVFLNELEIKRVVYKDASENLLKKIVNADMLLIKNLQSINETIKNVHEDILAGKTGDVVSKAAYIKKGIKDLRSILNDRGENV